MQFLRPILAALCLVPALTSTSCDDGAVDAGPTAPSYALPASEAWAGGALRIEWTGGDAEPTGAFLGSGPVDITIDSMGHGHIDIPRAARGSMEVRVVTGSREDSLGTVRVLNFAWHRSVSPGLQGMGQARLAGGTASIIGIAGDGTDGPVAELVLPEAEVRILLPDVLGDGLSGPGLTPDPNRLIAPAVPEEWQVAPHPVRTDSFPLPQEWWFRIINRVNDTLFVAVGKRALTTYTVVDGAVDGTDHYDEFDEGSEIRFSSDREWFAPRTWWAYTGRGIGVYSVEAADFTFRVPLWHSAGLAFSDASDTLFMAGLPETGGSFKGEEGVADSLFVYDTPTGTRLAARGVQNVVVDMIRDPDRPLLYVFSWLTLPERTQLTVLHQTTLEELATLHGPPAGDWSLYHPVAALDEEYVYLSFGGDVTAFDRPAGSTP